MLELKWFYPVARIRMNGWRDQLNTRWQIGDYQIGSESMMMSQRKHGRPKASGGVKAPNRNALPQR